MKMIWSSFPAEIFGDRVRAWDVGERKRLETKTERKNSLLTLNCFI